MKAKSNILSLTLSSKRYLIVLLIGVFVNFLAQIPYLLHQYHGAPSVIGTLLMMFVLAWFLVGYLWLWQGKTRGYVLLLAFLIIEFLFYLSTQITQAISGKGILLHVLHPDDPILFVVFGVGYINLLMSGFFIYYLLLHRHNLIQER